MLKPVGNAPKDSTRMGKKGGLDVILFESGIVDFFSLQAKDMSSMLENIVYIMLNHITNLFSMLDNRNEYPYITQV